MRFVPAGVGLLCVAICTPGPAFAISPYFEENFTAPGYLGGWGGGTPVNNPGTGGVDGANDGFLRISRPTPGNFGVRSSLSIYVDNYIAQGITGMTLQLNDVGTSENFEIHVGIGNTLNFWEYTQAFIPPENSWGEFFVDFTNQALWTPTGFQTTTLQDALMMTDRILIRHDSTPPSPTGSGPPSIAGDLGVDKIRFLPAPGSALVFAGGLLALARRGR